MYIVHLPYILNMVYVLVPVEGERRYIGYYHYVITMVTLRSRDYLHAN